MDFSGSSSEEHALSSDSQKNKKLYHRHTTHQIQQLETFFKRCAHPDDNQRNQMANEIGLEAKQVKFWFQNKRTQMKTQSEKMSNSSLRAQNERILCENHAIREALKNVLCSACGGPPCGDDEERQRSLVLLQHQNAELRQEHERMLTHLSRYIGKPLPEVEKLIATSIPKRSAPPFSMMGSSPLTLRQQPHKEGDNSAMTMERTLMIETAESAFNEIVSLLGVDEPLWIKPDGRSNQVLHRDHYRNIVMRNTNNNLNRTCATNGRFESSKYSAIVSLAGVHLVDLFLDSSKWVDLFHTIVTEAKTIDVLENGALGSKHGALQLMYGKMHIFSPLIPSREIYFLRNVKHVEEGAWIIVDVSFDCDRKFPSPNCWKFPSGFMIQDLPNGTSKVTWVEHVQVDDKGQLHKLYKDIVSNNSSIAFGAERWVRMLQRMCQRYAYSAKSSAFEIGGVRIMSGSNRGVMKLSERMVKGFCEILGMSGNFDYLQLPEANSSGIRISVRKGFEEGQPFGTIVTAATSIWIPLPSHSLFEFFIDDQNRLQWDALYDGRPRHELVHISTGDDPANCISIKRPLIPTQNNLMLLQESCIDPSGSLIAYAPIDFQGLGMAIRSEEDALKVPILPSGVIITTDGRSIDNDRPGSSSAIMYGSLLTLAFQILLTGDHMDVEAVANVNALVSSTIQKIKLTLNCPNLD